MIAVIMTEQKEIKNTCFSTSWPLSFFFIHFNGVGRGQWIFGHGKFLLFYYPLSRCFNTEFGMECCSGCESQEGLLVVRGRESNQRRNMAPCNNRAQVAFLGEPLSYADVFQNIP